LQIHGRGPPCITRARHELLQALHRRFDRLCRAEHFLLDEIADVSACLRDGFALIASVAMREENSTHEPLLPLT
jgi:hypothetical protein